VRGASLAPGAAAPAPCSTPRDSRCGMSSGGPRMDLLTRLRDLRMGYHPSCLPPTMTSERWLFCHSLGVDRAVCPNAIAQFGHKRKANPGCITKQPTSQNPQCSKSSSAAGSVAGSPCVDLDASTRTYRSAPGTHAAMPTAREESTKQGLARRDARPAPRKGKRTLPNSIAPHLIRRVRERIGVPSELFSELFQRNTRYSELTPGDGSARRFNPARASSSRPSWRTSHGCSHRSLNNPERTSDREC
jgi:hypothetical protein